MLPGVAGIEGRPDRAGTLTILARPGAQILPALNRLIHGNGWRVSGLRTEHGQLEEVFRQLTRETPHDRHRHHFQTRAGQLFRHAARLCVHPDLPRPLRRGHLLPGRLLRARPGRPGAVLFQPALALPPADPRAGHAPVGRGAQVRLHRDADDPARLPRHPGHRQVPGGLVLRRAGVAADLPDAADGELPRLARQRRDHRRLPGRLAAVRRLPGHRILHVGAGEESDHRLCPDRSRLPAVRRRRHSPRATGALRLASAMVAGRHCLAERAGPFRGARPGRARRPRPGLLLQPDRRLAGRHHHHHRPEKAA